MSAEKDKANYILSLYREKFLKKTENIKQKLNAIISFKIYKHNEGKYKN